MTKNKHGMRISKSDSSSLTTKEGLCQVDINIRSRICTCYKAILALKLTLLFDLICPWSEQSTIVRRVFKLIIMTKLCTL